MCGASDLLVTRPFQCSVGFEYASLDRLGRIKNCTRLSLIKQARTAGVCSDAPPSLSLMGVRSDHGRDIRDDPGLLDLHYSSTLTTSLER